MSNNNEAAQSACRRWMREKRAVRINGIVSSPLLINDRVFLGWRVEDIQDQFTARL